MLLAAALFLSLILPGTAAAFECSSKLDSCSNKKEICDKFDWANKVSSQQCLRMWNKYKGSGNDTCNKGIKDTYYSCVDN